MAKTYDIKIDQGADKSLRLEMKDCEGNALKLDGYTARMQIRPTVTNAELLDELTTENGRIEIDAASGTVVLKFPHSVTEGYPNRTPPPAYWYDIEIVSADDEVTRVLEGKVIIRANATR